MQAATRMPKGLCHVVTVGTTPQGLQDDVVSALIADLKGTAPRHVTVLATEDSTDNARRMLKGLGITEGKKGLIRLLKSAQSLDEAYIATNEIIAGLLADGVEAKEIILHYTAGTKVMSAGAVLAAVNNDVQSLRYIYSQGRRSGSVPVTTMTAWVMGDKSIRLATTLLSELRFRSAQDALADVDESLLSTHQRETRNLITGLGQAYDDWDRFRAKEFLDRYQSLRPALEKHPALKKFVLGRQHLVALEKISAAAIADVVYPDELLLDLLNNAIRRLVERRPDDALIRLQRAAELYAQSILQREYGIRTDDVEIRKVPPRTRTSFEAERRFDDAKIKIGLRKSFELLEVLGHPIGKAYREHEQFQRILNSRRHLVLAHGTRPATMENALDFLQEVEDLFKLSIKDVRRRAAAQQFPWIRNEEAIRKARMKAEG